MPEQMPAGAPAETGPAARPEQGPAAMPERAATPAAAPMAVPTIPLPITPTASPASSQAAVSTTTNMTTPAITDDGDLIEKVWVDKAKAIVEHTRDDPYKQSEELTVVKADYLQKRYNKTIKLSK